MATSEDVPEIARRLREAFGTPRWEPDLPPLDELVQTILSQQTAGPNSRRAYDQLRSRFPQWEDVAGAEPEEIDAAIRSAGLARLKAPRIKRIVVQIWEERGSFDLSFLATLPVAEAMAWLMHLPGVGQTTAGCCLLFGLDRPAMPVDTGILRIARRLGLVPAGGTPERVERALEEAVPAEAIYALHVNLIHFGRQICRASEPLCEVCPLNDLCDYFAAPRRAPWERSNGAAAGTTTARANEQRRRR